ncbi:S-adenosyl-L-methionine-dependent methyltransferase, partial [Mycena amicta]
MTTNGLPSRSWLYSLNAAYREPSSSVTMSFTHQHQHPHQPHGHDFASANQAFFDEHAQQADHRPMAGEVAQSVRDAILRAYSFDADSTTVLDFACGTGIVSHGLAAHCKTLVGVDISQGMVDRFNKSAAEQGISPEKMHAVRVELKGQDSELDGAKFDVVMCSLAFHHIADVLGTTRLLSFYLKPGGVLLVVDFPAMDISQFPVEAQAMIPHTHGVSETLIRDAYEKAGLGEFEWTLFKRPKGDMHPEDTFIAKGVK